MIEGRINGQRLELSFDVVVSDSVKYLTIKFICDSSWDGTVKKAIFTYEGKSFAVVLDEGNPQCSDANTCVVPFEVIQHPGFTVSLLGNDEDKIITSSPCFVPVIKSGDIDGAKPLEPTPDQYAQIIEICAQSKQIADSVRADADNGLFKGDKGEKGEKGDKGENNPEYTKYDILRKECEEAAEKANTAAEDASKVRAEVAAGGFIESIKEQNDGEKFTVWVGTQAKYDALTSKENNCLYIIEDDDSLETSVTELKTSVTKSLMKVLNNGFNIDNLKENGKFAVFNATGNLPIGYSADDNNFFIESYMWFEHFGRQILHDVRTNKTFSRNLSNDVWQPFELFDTNEGAAKQVRFIDLKNKLLKQQKSDGVITITTEEECYLQIRHLSTISGGYGAIVTVDSEPLVSVTTTSDMPHTFPPIPLQKGQVISVNEYARCEIILFGVI